MKWTLFKADLRSNAFIWMIFMYVLCMYFTIITYMYDPTTTSAMLEMMEMLPSSMVAGLGFDNVASDLTGFVVNFYYGFLVFAFPMIYCIIVSNRLVARMVDNGSFAYLLMSPTSRRTIIVTKGVCFLLSIALMFIVLHLVGVFVCRSFFGDLLNVQVLTRVNISAGLLTMVVGMICFFYSCLFNESKNALAMATTVPLGSLLLNMIGGVSDKSQFLADMSFYSLINTQEILEGSSNIGTNILMIGIIACLFYLSVWIFEKKNLPI